MLCRRSLRRHVKRRSFNTLRPQLLRSCYFTQIPCFYVFVEIKSNVNHLIGTVILNIENSNSVKIILAATVQFASAIRSAKLELERHGFTVIIPQSKPLLAGEVLGGTAGKVSVPESELELECIVVFIADGRFHLEVFMIANPRIKASDMILIRGSSF